MEGNKIKEIKRQGEERKKKEEEALKEAEKLAVAILALKELQKAAEVCKKEVDSLTEGIRVDL